jgi:hypothetical protein
MWEHIKNILGLISCPHKGVQIGLHSDNACGEGETIFALAKISATKISPSAFPEGFPLIFLMFVDFFYIYLHVIRGFGIWCD